MRYLWNVNGNVVITVDDMRLQYYGGWLQEWTDGELPEVSALFVDTDGIIRRIPPKPVEAGRTFLWEKTRWVRVPSIYDDPIIERINSYLQTKDSVIANVFIWLFAKAENDVKAIGEARTALIDSLTDVGSRTDDGSTTPDPDRPTATG